MSMAAGYMRKVDTTRLLAKLERANAATPSAAREALRIIIADTATKVVRLSPRDTQRYVRGWTMAFADVGVKNLPPVTVRKSRDFGRQLMRLVRQAELWERRAEAKRQMLQSWYFDKGRELDRFAMSQQAQLAKLEEIARRAREELNKFLEAREAAIVIGRSNGAWGKRNLITTRPRLYGGDGVWIVTKERVIVRLRNKEPHARIVEARSKVMFKATTAARSMGVRNARDHFARAVLKASGMTSGRGVINGRPSGALDVL